MSELSDGDGDGDRDQSTFIGFTGAGGVGKTTVAKALLEGGYLPGYQFLPSASRAVFKSFGVELEDDQDYMTPATRWQLQTAIQIAHRKSQMEHEGKQVIADRTQIDQFVYAIMRCSDHIGPMELMWLRKRVTDALPLYRRIFYFPLVTYDGHKDDGMRTHMYGMRYQFDLLLRAAMTSFGVRCIIVPDGSVKERCEFVKTHAQ